MEAWCESWIKTGQNGLDKNREFECFGIRDLGVLSGGPLVGIGNDVKESVNQM